MRLRPRHHQLASDGHAGEGARQNRHTPSRASVSGDTLLGETIRQATIRETLEETGIETQVTGISGIYTNPNHVLHYTSNDEVRQEFSVVFTARAVAGEPTPSSESSQVKWVSPEALKDHVMHVSMRKRLDHYLSGDTQPYLD